jgi:hypothetical protein
MRNDLERRLEALEEKAKPRMISTYVDFVLWASSDVTKRLHYHQRCRPLLRMPRCTLKKEPKHISFLFFWPSGSVPDSRDSNSNSNSKSEFSSLDGLRNLNRRYLPNSRNFSPQLL